jgi:histidine triad (HIT) family protein
MSYDQQNIFAKILRGEADCFEVFQDEHTLAFMDVMPQGDGHTLVIPKEPAETLVDLSDDAAMSCIRTVKKIVKAIKQAFDVSGVIVMQLNGAEAGQTVPHIHFHIIPGSIHAMRAHAKDFGNPDQLRELAEKIKSCIE